MNQTLLPLSSVPEGKEVILVAIKGGRCLRARLTDMGLNEGTRLKVLYSHGFGPCIILVNDTRLILGYGMAQKILVKEV